MEKANYTAISDGTILLQVTIGKKIIVKKFKTLDEAIRYADSLKS